MPFDWRFRNFKRDPQPFLNGAVIDEENARNNLVQNAGNSMEGYTPLESTLAAQAMEGYKPVVPATQSQLAAGASQAMEGYTPNSAGRLSVPNDMHGGNAQPDLDGYGAKFEADIEEKAKQEQIANIQSKIEALQTSIAEKQAKLKNWNGDDVANKVAALEARKFFSQDPTSIWRWKQDKDYATQLAAKQNGTDNTAKANAMIEIANDLDSIIVDDKMTSQDQKAYLSKLSNLKTLGEKAGVPKSVIDNINAKIKEVKGDGGEQTSREKAKTDWKGLKGKPDLTSKEIQTALDNPEMNWDPDERKEAENLRDKLKKHEAATQDVKNMKNWLSANYGIDYNKLEDDERKSWQEIWKAQKKGK